VGNLLSGRLLARGGAGFAYGGKGDGKI